MEKKWTPCVCTIILGLAVVAVVWANPSWTNVALYILGGLVVIKGVIGTCCCSSTKKKDSCGC